MQRWGMPLLALLLIAAWPAEAELRIGFINSEIILQQYVAVERAMETFNRDVEGWQQELEQMSDDLESLQQELDHQSLMLSDERRQEKELEYQRQLTEYEKLKESIWASDGLVEQRNEELLRPIINSIQAVLEQIATEEGYDFIFDAADNNILYGDPGYDLTDRVVETLNAEAGEQ